MNDPEALAALSTNDLFNELAKRFDTVVVLAERKLDDNRMEAYAKWRGSVHAAVGLMDTYKRSVANEYSRRLNPNG